VIIDGVMDEADKEDWYLVLGPVGSLVEIDLDANGGADDRSGNSPLDAVIEIWHSGHELPVNTLKDTSSPKTETWSNIWRLSSSRAESFWFTISSNDCGNSIPSTGSIRH